MAIRNTIINQKQGYFEGTTTVEMAVAPIIEQDILPFGLKGRDYGGQVNIQQDTGTSPFIFSISGLPQGHGLTVDSTGHITGILGLEEDTYNFTINVTDGLGYVTSENFQLEVHEPPAIEDEYIPGAVFNEPYSFTPTVTGTNGNLVYSIVVTQGIIPTGLSIASGNISGTPTVDGQSCEITITAYNDYDNIGVTKVYTLLVASAPNINTISPLRNGVLNQSYGNLQFSAAGVTPIQ